MSVPATGSTGNSAAAACCSDAVIISDNYNRITEDRNSSDMSNTLQHNERTSLIERVNWDVNAACVSSCSDRLFADDSVTMSSSAVDKMCNELEPSVVRVIEPEHPTEVADEMRTLVSPVATAAEPVDGAQQTATEQCQSDVVTFNVPLEVIGACWFMKRGTATCLQATTSNDGLFCCVKLRCCWLINIGVQSTVIICLSVCSHNSKTTLVNFTKFFCTHYLWP